jgi:hydroxyacylglutathione hydrolase
MHDSLSRLMKLPDGTRVYCGHEYTLSNIRFAKAADPANTALRELEVKAAKLRDQDLPTLPSTIGQEKSTNPFVRCLEPAVIASASKFAGKQLADPVSVLAAIREWKNGF